MSHQLDLDDDKELYHQELIFWQKQCWEKFWIGVSLIIQTLEDNSDIVPACSISAVVMVVCLQTMILQIWDHGLAV